VVRLTGVSRGQRPSASFNWESLRFATSGSGVLCRAVVPAEVSNLDGAHSLRSSEEMLRLLPPCQDRSRHTPVKACDVHDPERLRLTPSRPCDRKRLLANKRNACSPSAWAPFRALQPPACHGDGLPQPATFRPHEHRSARQLHEDTCRQSLQLTRFSREPAESSYFRAFGSRLPLVPSDIALQPIPSYGRLNDIVCDNAG